MELLVHFNVYASGIRMGGVEIVGYAEERIRRPAANSDSGWPRGTNQIGGEFNWDTQKIVDKKVTYVSNEDWFRLLAPYGTVIDDFFQQNRFVIEDCNGNQQYYYFDERRFLKRKNGVESIELVEY